MKRIYGVVATVLSTALLGLTACGGGGEEGVGAGAYVPGQDGNYYLAGYLSVCPEPQCVSPVPAAEVDASFSSPGRVRPYLTTTDGRGYFEIALPKSEYDSLPQQVCVVLGSVLYFTRINGAYENILPSSQCFDKLSLVRGYFDRRAYPGAILPAIPGGTQVHALRATDRDVLLERYMSGFTSPIIHLGDASFGGSANAELQAGTQGTSATFVPRIPGGVPIPADATQFCVEFIARGIQTSSGNADQVGVDAGSWLRTTWVTPQDSPGDGSFGFSINCVDLVGDRPANARMSALSVTLRAGGRSGTTDLDDFEFHSIVGRFH